jgi:hypothetical protein
MAQSNARALSGMHPDVVSSAASFLTVTCEVICKHVDVAAHSYHVELKWSNQRGARDLSRIELLPMPLCRREPKKIIGPFCTVQHAHTRVILESHNDSSSYWTVYKFFASQSLHNIKFLKKKIRRSKRQRNFSLFYFASQES